MPSDSEVAAEYRSLSRWLRVVAFALGVGLVALANVGYVVTGYQDGLVFAATGVVGGVVALAAAATLVVDLLPESTAPTPDDRQSTPDDD